MALMHRRNFKMGQQNQKRERSACWPGVKNESQVSLCARNAHASRAGWNRAHLRRRTEVIRYDWLTINRHEVSPTAVMSLAGLCIGLQGCRTL